MMRLQRRFWRGPALLGSFFVLSLTTVPPIQAQTEEEIQDPWSQQAQEGDQYQYQEEYRSRQRIRVRTAGGCGGGETVKVVDVSPEDSSAPSAEPGIPAPEEDRNDPDSEKPATQMIPAEAL
jgi:hypothetical protein